MPPIERLLAIDRINNIYERFHRKVVNEDVFESVFATALDELNVRFPVQRGRLDHIPAKGPLVIVANHPFGAVEGLILGALLLRAARGYHFFLPSVIVNKPVMVAASF